MYLNHALKTTKSFRADEDEDEVGDENVGVGVVDVVAAGVDLVDVVAAGVELATLERINLKVDFKVFSPSVQTNECTFSKHARSVVNS